MTVPSADKPVMTAMMPIARGSDDSSRITRFHMMLVQLLCLGAAAAPAPAPAPTAAAGMGADCCCSASGGAPVAFSDSGTALTSGALLVVSCCCTCFFFLPVAVSSNFDQFSLAGPCAGR